ncbi:ABC transporter ATP-binding protein [uncultured Propionibacterium sp.]|uniref:ABC transporter ATP-binding protein n=1 Tax=uncultured Propionibacterium sp. TaxID=218066 RepID=UPI00292E7B62|nr:ABC transporter ATP-binding protein [uncultured Propionibacterium sp.]
MPIIKVNDLSFSYARARESVFSSFSWTVDRGECIGILGHNGAGKTTLLKLLYGVLRPSRGSVQINIHDVASYREIFLLSGRFGLDRQVSLHENLEFRRRLFGTAGFDDLKGYWMDRLGFTEYAHKRIFTLSAGLEMRAQLVAGLCLNPRLILLDEPTNSMDPATRETVISLLNGMRAEGRTCLFVTHDLEFARRVSSRVMILHEGAIVVDDPVRGSVSPEEFTKRYLHVTEGRGTRDLSC